MQSLVGPIRPSLTRLPTPCIQRPFASHSLAQNGTAQRRRNPHAYMTAPVSAPASLPGTNRHSAQRRFHVLHHYSAGFTLLGGAGLTRAGRCLPLPPRPQHPTAAISSSSSLPYPPPAPSPLCLPLWPLGPLACLTPTAGMPAAEPASSSRSMSACGGNRVINCREGKAKGRPLQCML